MVLLLVAGWVLASIPNDGIRKNVLSSDAHQGQVEIVSTCQVQKRNQSLLMNLSGETAWFENEFPSSNHQPPHQNLKRQKWCPKELWDHKSESYSLSTASSTNSQKLSKIGTLLNLASWRSCKPRESCRPPAERSSRTEPEVSARWSTVQ